MFQEQLPLVGRDADLRLLELVLGRAAAGTGSVVLISGEAGIGKTRLCHELARWHRSRGGQVLLGRAFPEESAISFGPVGCDDSRQRGSRTASAMTAGTARDAVPAVSCV